MLSKVLLIIPALLMVFAISVHAENYLTGPESVAFDSLRNRYLVSNVRDGSIVSIDMEGNQEYFKQGMGSCLGNCIVGNTIFVAVGRNVVGVNLDNPDDVTMYSGSGWANLDGMTADTSGYLYVVATESMKIYKIKISDGTYSTFVDGSIPINTQDIFFDIQNNRLLGCVYANNAPILAVDLADSSVSTFLSPAPGLFDGITMDADGNVYAATHAGGGQVIMWDNTYTNPWVVVSSGHNQPAGLDYNFRDDVLAVPEFAADTVKFIECGAPYLTRTGRTLDDSAGDTDGLVDAGESISMMVTLRNEGWSIGGVNGHLSSTDPNVSITTADAGYGECYGWGAETVCQTPFVFAVDAACPDPYVLPLVLEVTGDDAYTITDTLYVFVGETAGFSDDMESGAPSWQHHALSKGLGENWHLESYRSVSGDYSWKMGGLGAEPYSNNSDAALITPPFLVPERPIFTFQYFIDAEIDAEPGLAWDGGIVMISSGDGNWTQLMPEGGYPYAIVANPASPFEAGTPCYSGAEGWVEAMYDLSAYSGVVQIMFRFGSDALANGEGWYVDDINIYFGGCCYDPTGDVDASGATDISDLTFLVEYFFNSGPSPVCPEEADMDASAELNVSDLTYFVEYLFGGGPGPMNCL